MAKVVTQSSVMIQWHELVKEAQSIYGRQLGDDLEHYLTVLLQHYADKPEVLAGVLAFEYLQAMEQQGTLQKDTLREVGDKCLLYSGLFPEQADSKQVSINYFVDLGKSSYSGVAESITQQAKLAKLFDDLEKHFVGMMDVLHTIREMGGIEQQLSLLHAFDLWQHTKSEYAREVIERHTDSPFLDIVTKNS